MASNNPKKVFITATSKGPYTPRGAMLSKPSLYPNLSPADVANNSPYRTTTTPILPTERYYLGTPIKYAWLFLARLVVALAWLGLYNVFPDFVPSFSSFLLFQFFLMMIICVIMIVGILIGYGTYVRGTIERLRMKYYALKIIILTLFSIIFSTSLIVFKMNETLDKEKKNLSEWSLSEMTIGVALIGIQMTVFAYMVVGAVVFIYQVSKDGKARGVSFSAPGRGISFCGSDSPV